MASSTPSRLPIADMAGVCTRHEVDRLTAQVSVLVDENVALKMERDWYKIEHEEALRDFVQYERERKPLADKLADVEDRAIFLQEEVDGWKFAIQPQLIELEKARKEKNGEIEDLIGREYHRRLFQLHWLIDATVVNRNEEFDDNISICSDDTVPNYPRRDPNALPLTPHKTPANGQYHFLHYRTLPGYNNSPESSFADTEVLVHKATALFEDYMPSTDTYQLSFDNSLEPLGTADTSFNIGKYLILTDSNEICFTDSNDWGPLLPTEMDYAVADTTYLFSSAKISPANDHDEAPCPSSYVYDNSSHATSSADRNVVEELYARMPSFPFQNEFQTARAERKKKTHSNANGNGNGLSNTYTGGQKITAEALAQIPSVSWRSSYGMAKTRHPKKTASKTPKVTLNAGITKKPKKEGVVAKRGDAKY
ncbi:MAG: hypothetical protein MMC33_000653 [Icmadophila ericetorum]|nr:hypothetical protein [Icmadophila ericetorum]